MRHRRAALLFVVVCCGARLSGGVTPSRVPNPVTFEDVTRASGIQFKNYNSPTPEKYLIETMTGAVAVFDYDNDGWPDVFLVNGARVKSGQKDSDPIDKSSPDCWNRLYHNNHDGTFTDVTEKAGVRGTGYGMG